LTKACYTYKIEDIIGIRWGNMRKIGYLGPAGTFSEQAALFMLQSCPGELIPYGDVPELIMAVQSGALHCAVVPIENVLEGTVNNH
jgi:prephenate dehydratase